MAMGRVFGHQFAPVSGHTASGTTQLHDVLVNNAYHPASASFVNVAGYERVHILILLGELADTVAFQVYEAEAADGTPDTLGSDYLHTVAADDDNEFVAFTIEVADLSTDHHYLCVKTTGVSGSNYAAIIFLLEGMDLPVSATALPSASIHHKDA